MTEFFRETDGDLSLIQGRRAVVLGYGSQGRAQALNLRDVGVSVSIGLREGSRSIEVARSDGFYPVSLAEATEGAEFVLMALPDVVMGQVFEDSVRDHLAPGACVVFAHGFAVQYGLVEPPPNVDVVLVAPMGAGPVVRRRFEAGSGVPALLAVHRDATGHAWHRAKAYGAAIGSGRAAMLSTTFREETESDLFGEQAVLCGGLPELIRAAFDTLTAGGIAPEIAYIACLHEVKLIADLIFERGLDGMVESISATAEWGAYSAGPRIIGNASREALRDVWNEIHDGRFARSWMASATEAEQPLNRLRQQFLHHPIHGVGQTLRPRLNPS